LDVKKREANVKKGEKALEDKVSLYSPHGVYELMIET
jgi:hypothetical protein